MSRAWSGVGEIGEAKGAPRAGTSLETSPLKTRKGSRLLGSPSVRMWWLGNHDCEYVAC